MLTKQQMLAAVEGLIDEAERLHAQFLTDFLPWSAEFASWLKACESTVEAIFGSASHALSSFKNIYFLPPPWEEFTNDAEKLKAELTWFDSGLRYAHASLVGYRYSVERLATEEPVRGTPYIFVSHGGPTLTHVYLVRDFLVALGLGPVIVRDLPNLNLSVNEKVRIIWNCVLARLPLLQSRTKRPRGSKEHGQMSKTRLECFRPLITSDPESCISRSPVLRSLPTTRRRSGSASQRSARRMPSLTSQRSYARLGSSADV